jgi:hypothetical protein
LSEISFVTALAVPAESFQLYLVEKGYEGLLNFEEVSLLLCCGSTLPRRLRGMM